MQFINNIILSLALNAKGYKNFGNFTETGEKKFIQSNLSIHWGWGIGMCQRFLKISLYIAHTRE